MSRCFPFPPPGYEKKARSSEHGYLLAKEKYREKKHKEKDKEKREGKERKDKGRSKDKHKEKKDEKEKHRDKKKDKEKDKNKTSEDQRRTEHLSEVQHKDKLGYDKQKVEEINDSKFMEEFGRRIKDCEQRATNCMVKNLSSTTQKRVESITASTGPGKENSTGNKVAADVTGTVQQRNEKLAPSFQKQTVGLDIAVNSQKQKVAISEKAPQFNSSNQGRKDILIPQMQKRIGSTSTATTMEMQRAASNEKIGDCTSADQKRNITPGLPMDKVRSSVQRTEGVFVVNSMQKERMANNNMVSNSIGAAAKRNDGMEQSTKSLNNSVSRRIEDMRAAPAMEKERSLFPNIIRTEQRTDRMDKTKEKRSKDEKKEGHKEKKRKDKDKDRQKKKKVEEKKRGKKHTHKKHDKLKECRINDQHVSLNNKTNTTLKECGINDQIASDAENINTTGADGINKKRKEFEKNGFLHELQIDGRLNKLQRTSASFSSSTVKNGRPLELIHNIKLEAINHFKNERGLDNNGNHLNGKVKIQPSDVCRPHIGPPITVDSSKKDQIPSIKPHPDTKYLGTIYSVPKMEELMESDDQDWLFSNKNPHSSSKLETDGTPPQVWARGLLIEAADIFALPYVIPY